MRLEALRRIALAVARPVDDAFVQVLVAELAAAMSAATAFVATFTDESRRQLRTLAAWFDGRPLPNFGYEVAGSPCERVVGQAFRFIASGALAEIDPSSVFAEARLDSYAAFPLNDTHGTPLGVLAVMDRRPLAGGDAAHAEVMLKVVAGRLGSELERRHTLEVMQQAALAVSAAQGTSVFDELVRMLAALLRLEFAFVARHDAGDPGMLELLALHADGRILHDLSYPVATSPCRHVLGQQFRAYPSGLAQLFPDDAVMLVKGAEGYAGHPLTGHDGEALGVIAVGSRHKLVDLDRIEAILKIFAVRASAELERLRAVQAMQRSEASYRTIFEAAEDAIFVHDWDTFQFRDLNRKAVDDFGYTREELLAIDPAALMSGVPPYDMAHALAYLKQAKLGRCAPFEWHTRLKDGRLQWQEVHLKPVVINGEPQILAFTRNITERKAAEEKLRAGEAQYRAIFDASADALMLWDSQLKRVDVNSAHERIFGFAREDVVGRAFEGLPYPEAEARPRLEMVQRALEGEASRAEIDAIRKDGTRILTELRTIPFMHRGQPHALQIARDITERKKAELALRDSEAQYRAIFDTSADALVLWGRDLRFVDVNRAYTAMYGFTRDDVLGTTLDDRLPPAELATRTACMRAALAGEEGVLEATTLRKDGTPFDVELRYLPITHLGVPHVLAVARDITERKKTEADLRASEAQYRAIFNASVDALTLWDSRMRRVDVNSAYLRMYGWAREDVIGQGYEQLPFGADYYTPRQDLVRRALAGESCSAELESIRKDGRRILTEIHAVPFTHRGEPHVLVIGRDITDRRAGEDERARLEAQLRQAQKMEAIGQLTGGIAHDFNNILTSVLGYTVLAQERAEALADARLQRQLGQARLATERARDLVAQMLAFARRKPGARRALEIAPLVRQAIGLLRPTLPSSVMIDVQADDAALPLVEADAVQLEQVLFNLCINARDAVHGAGNIRIGLQSAQGGWRCQSCGLLAPEGRWVELQVEDDGGGISAETMRRMFDPFFTTKPAGSGSGMGLAMVHGIVHDHGGHIGVRTSVGRGTRFSLLLPASVAAPAAPAQERRAAGPALPARTLLRGRVLLVEDDALAGDYLAEQLADWGLDVTVRRDARNALARLEDRGQAVDLLITDLTMPHMSGLQLAQRAAELRPALPVLLVSGDLGVADPRAMAEAGIRATLAKPLDTATLLVAIRGALSPR